MQHLSEGAAERDSSGKSSGEIFEVESVASLREKVHRLERELGALKSSSTSPDSSASQQEVAILQVVPRLRRKL